MKIVLIRHGKPVAASNPKVNAAGFAQWVREYNRSEVSLTNQPSDSLKQKVEGFYILSSDLRRSFHSAQLCVNKQPDSILKGLREMDIPRLKIPFSIKINSWLVISRLAWFVGISGKAEKYHQAKVRLTNAVDQLETKVMENGDIAVFGHGLSNRFLAKELQRRGWILESSNSGYWGTIELKNITRHSN